MNQTYTLITGANGGIGHALAVEFAEHGHSLLLHGRSEESLRDVVRICESLDVYVETIISDLALPSAADRLFAETKKRKLNVQFLVNNAGYGDFGLFEKTDLVKMNGMMSVNMVALTELTRLFLPSIIKNKGGVLNVASIVSFFPGPLMAVYYASKAYVLSFSNALQNELEGRVIVTALCPGVTKSNFRAAARLEKSKLMGGGMMTAEQVARIGYKGFMARKAIVTPGLSNKIKTILPRFLPKASIANIIRNIQSER